MRERYRIDVGIIAANGAYAGVSPGLLQQLHRADVVDDGAADQNQDRGSVDYVLKNKATNRAVTWCGS
jgi:hypothetical protein